jgi:hypothetical protein
MENIIHTTDALSSLRPKAEWTVRGNKIEWLDKIQVQPTQAEIDAEVVRLQAEYDAQDYARKRKAEYPDIYDYMDGIVKNDQAQIDKYIADAQAVKSKYPKGG